MGLSRNTVKRYLELPAPTRTEAEPRPRPTWERAWPRIDQLMRESSKWAQGKQRLTATQLHKMLVAENIQVGVTLVKEAVAEWKRQREEVFVPLVYHPGDLAEVDFFEVLVDIDNQRRKAWMFLMRLMHSGRDFAWLYDRQDQVCFLDGHVRAFAHFGGVPHRIAYDNLKAAVRKMLVGSERELSDRFRALVSHYLFEPCFCRPRTGHDKGGVEARGKGIRWQHLVPIPTGESLGAISTTLVSGLDERLNTVRSGGDGRTVGERFVDDHARMLPLPPPFIAAATRFVSVTPLALVHVDGARYSVPCAWHGLDVTVRVGAEVVEVLGSGGDVVRHPHQRHGGRSIDYRHYLPELAKKPQAVRQVAAELVRDLGEPYDAAWRLLCDAHGPRDAARVFAKVLSHVVERGIDSVAHRLRTALQRDEPLLLALEPAAPPPEQVAQEKLPTPLQALVVESGCAADYDGWLRGGDA